MTKRENHNGVSNAVDQRHTSAGKLPFVRDRARLTEAATSILKSEAVVSVLELSSALCVKHRVIAELVPLLVVHKSSMAPTRRAADRASIEDQEEAVRLS